MTDATVESRLSRVEQRVSDLDHRVSELVPVTNSVAVLTERVENLRNELAERDRNQANALARVGDQVNKLDDEIAGREIANVRERRDARRAMYILTATILAALITAAASVLSSAGHL